MTRSDLEAWGDERCGVYGRQALLIWCGPYSDAAVLDQVVDAWCWERVAVALALFGQASDALGAPS